MTYNIGQLRMAWNWTNWIVGISFDSLKIFGPDGFMRILHIGPLCIIWDRDRGYYEKKSKENDNE